MTKKVRRTLSYTIAIVVFALSLVAMLIMRNNTAIAEWWTMNISRHWAKAASATSALVPFSIFEWFIIFALFIGIFCIIAGIALLFMKHYRTFFNGLLAVALSVLVIANIYIMSAGFSYYRAPLKLEVSEQDYTYEQACDMYDYYLNDFNSLGATLNRDGQGNVIMPYSPHELVSKINAEYDKLDSNYYYSHTTIAKPMLNSYLMSITSILGISFLPTGEANYNNLMPQSDKPQTIAHEIAHQRGVMREGDANTVAEYILINSNDDYLRYCGYYNSIYSIKLLVSLLKTPNAPAQDDNAPFSDEIIREFKNGYAYWDSVRNKPLYKFFTGVSGFFNDLYLKANGRDDGTGDYNNSGENSDSGKTDDDGNKIYIYKFSLAECMYYQVYLNKTVK